MSNNKQSSVEWFAQESWKLRVELEDDKISIGEYANKHYQLKEQAKAMHEVQVRRAFYDGQRYEGTKSSMEYYNETYGGNNE